MRAADVFVITPRKAANDLRVGPRAVCDALGTTKQKLAHWNNSGVLVPDKAGQYGLGDLVNLITDHERKEAKSGKNGGSDVDIVAAKKRDYEERANKNRVDRERGELQLQFDRGEVLSRAEIDAEVSFIGGEARANISRLPRRLADLVDPKVRAVFVKEATDQVHQVLSELSDRLAGVLPPLIRVTPDGIVSKKKKKAAKKKKKKVLGKKPRARKK